MKHLVYPPFTVSCLVSIQLPDNKSRQPDIAIKVAFYINHWDDIHSTAKREAVWKLERLGVDKDTLKDAYFETDDHSYTAVEPKGVKREYGVPVEAFYLHDPKKRALLIRQRRLVPESREEMVAIYGKAEAAAKEVAA